MMAANRRRLPALVGCLISLLLVVVAGACTSGPPANRGGPEQAVALLRSTSNFNYVPFASPAAMRDKVDVAVYGAVDSVRAGTVRDTPDDTAVVVIRLRVKETWKTGGPQPDSIVTFIFPRPTNLAIEPYQQALPKGTGVALFGYRTVYTIVAGDPGGVVYDPFPQGLLIEIRPPVLVNVWGEVEGQPLGGWNDIRTVDDLRAALR